MRLLDLFCCAGGAGVGYARAGFEVVGVDIEPQPNYPFEFHQADAMSFPLGGFDAVHASPPCQAYTAAQRIQGNAHPDLLAPTRGRLLASGIPYIIDVPGAPLINPVMLCGAMFPELRVYRHRLFECSFAAVVPPHPVHVAPQVKMGRAPKPGEWVQPVGNFSGVAEARAAMETPWMTRDEIREAIPPAFTEFLGRQLAAHLTLEEAA